MKRLLLAFFLCATTSFAGSSLPPDGVVYAAIAAAHRNDLSQFIRCVDLPALAAHATHPLSPREAMSMLEKIEEPQIVLKVVGDSKEKKEVTVRMTKPLVMVFEVREIEAPSFGVMWIVTGIHP